MWSEASPFRPFCSERCRLIDLGAWVDEQRAIAGDEVVGGEAESSELPGADTDRTPRH